MTVPEVFKPLGIKLGNERSPQGYLRKPLEGTIISAQVDPSRILLAYNVEGCTSVKGSIISSGNHPRS